MKELKSVIDKKTREEKGKRRNERKYRMQEKKTCTACEF